MRKPESEEWLDACFEQRIQRKVRGDATVSVDKISYDVPPQFIGQRVELRFTPDRPHEFSLLFNDKRYTVRPTDRHENFYARREKCIDIDYGLEVSDNEND